MLKKIGFVLDKRQRRNVLILFFITFIGSFAELLGVSAIMPLVSIITDESIIKSNSYYIALGNIFGLDSAREFILFFAIVLIGIYILKNAYLTMQCAVQNKFAYNNQRRLSTEMLNHYIRQDYLFHVSKNVSELQRNIISDVGAFFHVVRNLLLLLNESLVCLMLVIYLAITDFVSTMLIAGLLLVFLFLFTIVFKRYSVKLGIRLREVAADQNKWVLQSFAGIKEMKVANKEHFFLKKYDHTYEEYALLECKQAVVTYLPKPLMESVCICGLLTIIAVRIYWGTEMKVFIPILSVFIVAAFRMLPSFNRLSGYYSSIMYGKASVDNIYRDVKEMRTKNESYQKTQEKFEFVMGTDIEVKEITFKYPQGETDVLEKVSFTIPRKKSVAFVGASGAGKSTMADVILGILEPQEGEILVDGRNIYRHIEDWHKKIGYIPQMIYLLDDSIKHNVAFGIDERDIDETKVWKALKEAQLDEFIMSLPDGLNTEVGERGIRLSGGQRQRIGIARALYSNPELLILDEATSALDNETERAVMESIDGLHGSRTMVIIAHRLSTIKNCDYVYEFKNRKVQLKTQKE